MLCLILLLQFHLALILLIYNIPHSSSSPSSPPFSSSAHLFFCSSSMYSISLSKLNNNSLVLSLASVAISYISDLDALFSNSSSSLFVSSNTSSAISLNLGPIPNIVITPQPPVFL
ncbi:hypothetical protein STK_13430 [Sulfurisphaera tokodaii str. 7]|uniref:Uncharacterized protein n=1 Tax=Sulfurisphaera tokodaii (strain DSM 16993 / JCM 10545 / NBRC 100140 / 7) TaxID=273063 RepID=Q971L8_SULTO|nr:hypothetical protein STK_13430 [Sulfurisphaera tokodaii str. 7]